MKNRPPDTIEQLRAAIDRGEQGDKVALSDPAAAPLGADDEAAGHPPTRQEMGLEHFDRPARSQLGQRGDRFIYPVLASIVGVGAILIIIFSLS